MNYKAPLFGVTTDYGLLKQTLLDLASVALHSGMNQHKRALSFFSSKLIYPILVWHGLL